MNILRFNPNTAAHASALTPMADNLLFGLVFRIRAAGEYYTGDGWDHSAEQAEAYYSIDDALLDAEHAAILHPDLHVEIVDAETDVAVYHTHYLRKALP